MGQKTHPTGFRLGGVIDWQSQWYANNGKSYSFLLNEDRNIREIIMKELGDNGAISKIEIERGSQDISVTVYTARPGIIIGKKGALLKEIGTESRKEISKYENKKIHLFLFVRLVKEKKA